MKLPLRIVLGVVVVLVLLGTGVVLFVDSLAKKAVEKGGSHALGVETRLDSASIGLFSGEFSLTGLEVANPPGFEHPNFFALRSTTLALPLSTLTEERITIPELVFDGVTLALERNDRGTNYGVILDNLGRFESGEPAPEEESGPGKQFLLKKLVLRDVRASVDLVLTKLSLAVPDIVVEDIGSEMTLPQICALVVKTVIQAAIDAGGDKLPAELLRDLRSRMAGLEDLARAQVGAELEKQAGKLGPEAEKALKQAEGELGKKLGGLFKK